MVRSTLIGLALLLSLGLVMPAAARGERVALVVGNGHYEHIPSLANPVSDAQAVADTLRGTGFTVIAATDTDRAGLEQAIRQFGEQARGADAALFFYAGHGLQYGDRNYLLPVGATVDELADLRYEAVPLDLVMAELQEADADVSLVILDACRDNPLINRLIETATAQGRSADTGRGLAVVRGARGTLIAYATAPGQIALDGDGSNSPFTTALVQWLPQPGLEIGVMFRKVRESVIEATAGAQVPWVEESILGEFYFVPQDAGAGAVPPPQTGPGDRAELLFWETIADSRDAADYQAYLRRFPDGVFADLARNRIEQIETTAVAALTLPAVRAEPANGAVDVATDVGSLVFTFDQPMHMDSWSLVTVPGYPFPPATGESARWRDPRTFELPVGPLLAETTYGLRLSGVQPEGFRSAVHDVPLPDTLVVFTTAAARPEGPPERLTIDLGSAAEDLRWTVDALRLLGYRIAEGSAPASDDVTDAVREFQDELGHDASGRLTADERVALSLAAAEAAAERADAVAADARERAEDARDAAGADDAFERRDEGRFLYRGDDPDRATVTVGVMEWLAGSGEEGERYEGEFTDRAIAGVGIAYDAVGGRYEGQFADWSGDGFGVRLMPDGSRLIGQWRGDLLNGFAIREDANGGRQVGAWSGGEPQGYGAYLHPDGRDDRGLWDAGRLVGRL